MSLRTFIGEFLNTESYSAYYEPISDHINFLVIIFILLIVGISITLIILLRYKKKTMENIFISCNTIYFYVGYSYLYQKLF